MSEIGSIGASGGLTADRLARLHRAAQEFEGLFLAQLFREMRASLPEGGLTDASPGQDLFTGLFDDAIATEAARRSTRGLGEALYRQLAARLGDSAGPAAES
jgi:flagellar protein FlgJ